MTRALFITGTGTGVGKTFVAAALLNNSKFIDDAERLLAAVRACR